jgi:hypothetical protein
MGNLMELLCVGCNENAPINFVRCTNCELDLHFSEMIDSELTLDWNN